MRRDLIKGHTALAEYLGVCRRTVARWSAEGVLAPACVVWRGRVRIYDADLVLKVLNDHHPKPGRPRKYF